VCAYHLKRAEAPKIKLWIGPFNYPLPIEGAGALLPFQFPAWQRKMLLARSLKI